MGFREKLRALHRTLPDVFDLDPQPLHRPEQLVLLRGSNQSIANNTWDDVDFEAAGIDSANMWNIAQPERIIIPRAGVWLCAGFVTFAPHGTGFREVTVSLFDNFDGAVLGDFGRTVEPNNVVGVSTAMPFIMFRPLFASADDPAPGGIGTHYRIRVRHTAGVALNVELCRLTIMRLSEYIDIGGEP